MTTDIERLHDVMSSNYGPNNRRVGKTYAHCHELCGVLETTDSEMVLCLVPRMQRVQHILPMLTQVLSEHGFAVVKRMQDTVVVRSETGERRLKFVSQNNDHALDGSSSPAVEFHD